MRLPALLMLGLAAAGQEAPTFTTRVSLVHVDVEVESQEGRILSGLAKEDFRVFDEGREQTIQQFAAGDDPLDLILLFDISGSMRPKVKQVAAAAREGVRELRDGDRVAVMVFNTHTRLVSAFTEDLDRVQRSIQEDVLALQFGGGTFIQNAVSDAAKRLMREPRTRRRRAVLIVTDDYGQRTKKEVSVVRDLWEADALLTGLIVRSAGTHAVQTINNIMHPYLISLQAGVRGIAEKTGGDFIHSGEPGAAFQESMRRIRNRYSLYYTMPDAKPGARRSVRVELSEGAARLYPRARVRARTGYFVPAE